MSRTQPATTTPIPRLWRWYAVAASTVVVLTIVLVGVARFRPGPHPLPPTIDTAGFDPAVASAIDRDRTAVVRSGRNAEAWGRLGMVLLAHELHPGARQCFDQACHLAPKEPRWFYYLGLAQMAEMPLVAITNLDRAVRLLSRGSAASADHGSGPRLRLAQALFAVGRLDDAEAHYREILEANSTSPSADLGLGQIAHARNSPEDAVEHLGRALRDPATRRAAHRLLVSVYQRLNRTNEVRQLSTALSRLPADERPAHPYDAELEALKTGENAWIDRADEWIKAGRAAEAARLLEQTIQAYPNSDRAKFFLGRARQRLGDVAGAESILTGVIARSPGKIEAQIQLGVLYLGQGRDREAERCFRSAILEKPNLGEAWYNLGLSLGRKDRAESAAAFREAIRLKPNLVEAYLGLSVVLRAEGQSEAAAAALRQALAFQPEEPLRQRLVQQLRSLGATP